jgi:hypothetical protein
MSEVSETPMPNDGWRSSGDEGFLDGGCWEERVKISSTIAPGYLDLGVEILRWKTKWVKLDRTIIVDGKAMNGN